MKAERIVVFPGDTPDALARDFCDQHSKFYLILDLDEETLENLHALLE